MKRNRQDESTPWRISKREREAWARPSEAVLQIRSGSGATVYLDAKAANSPRIRKALRQDTWAGHWYRPPKLYDGPSLARMFEVALENPAEQPLPVPKLKLNAGDLAWPDVYTARAAYLAAMGFSRSESAWSCGCSAGTNGQVYDPCARHMAAMAES